MSYVFVRGILEKEAPVVAEKESPSATKGGSIAADDGAFDPKATYFKGEQAFYKLKR